MSHEVANDSTSLRNELKLAYDKADREFPERRAEINTVFQVVDNLHYCIIRMDDIAFKPTPHGPLSVDEIDELHSILHSNTEAFGSFSQHSKALFTWREHAVEWRGHQNSNIVEAIQDEALQYSLILHKCSLRKPFVPESQWREHYPEPWFDISGVQQVAMRVRERLNAEVKPTSVKPNRKGVSLQGADKSNPWSDAFEAEARRILNAEPDMGSNEFCSKVGGKRGTAQELYRLITGKKKRKTRND